ncbi:MAG: SpoIID/LytB domain-containing protein [Pseudanabaenaceae cyanobacterium bins.68]|nr:SpoIID/LytB domain-containing protein [Pseudanabaenaceae cyanobacterium bins.68]
MNRIIYATLAPVLGNILGSNLSGQPSLASPTLNPILEIGIVQRFGEKPQDQITLRALPGDRLYLKFGKTSLTAEQITLSLSRTPLASPETVEKLILSNHRSFENAAASAFRLKEKGVATEIAQPRRWQVWAQRDRFATPLSQHLLLLGLQGKGYVQVQPRTHLTQVTWQVAGNRYQGDRLGISSGRGVIQVNNRPYGGSLRVQPNAHDSFTLVNLVPLETYLRGVVPHEIGYQAPFAAVQAQAVLARTYALASRHRFKVDQYELCATTQCQVYRGLEQTTTTADQAITSTKAQVLTYQERVIDALYSSNTGGVTANYNDLWDGEPRPYLQSVFDTVNNPLPPQQRDLSQAENLRTFLQLRQGFNEQQWRTFRWQKSSTLAEITQGLQEFLRLSGDRATKLKQVKSLTVKQRAKSGRVLQLEVETDAGMLTIEKDEIIDAFLAPNSTFFELQPILGADATLQGYSFSGGGLGHGVGMSQTGSYYLAGLGWDFARILRFYYSGVKLQKLRPGMW